MTCLILDGSFLLRRIFLWIMIKRNSRFRRAARFRPKISLLLGQNSAPVACHRLFRDTQLRLYQEPQPHLHQLFQAVSLLPEDLKGSRWRHSGKRCLRWLSPFRDAA